MKNTFKKTIEKIITWQAKLILKKYQPKIVAVTGSVGKTSAKDAIATAIAGASSFSVRKSEKSFNTEIGVPLTILGMPNGWNNPLRWLANIFEGFLLIIFRLHYPDWLVLEVGANRPGDIEQVSRWLSPDVVVLTHFADVPVHVEFFSSVEALVSEKGRLVAALKPAGTLVLNADDSRVMGFIDSVAGKKITYGFADNATVRASYTEISYGPTERSDVAMPTGLRFRLDYAGSSFPLALQGALGKQHVYPVAAAFAVACGALGLNPLVVSQALVKHATPPGRMHLLPGLHETIIIDDTYNSSPVAVAAALSVLDELRVPGRKIAVLGDMMELGDYSAAEHRHAGELVAAMAKRAGQSSEKKETAEHTQIANPFPVVLVAVGVRMRAAADAALDAGMDELAVLQFDTSSEAGRYLADELQAGDAILVKGSQSMRTERAVLELMEHPEQADELLVRHDSVWKRKG